jgi:hypothetical protein
MIAPIRILPLPAGITQRGRISLSPSGRAGPRAKHERLHAFIIPLPPATARRLWNFIAHALRIAIIDGMTALRLWALVSCE